jgi:hypothetical protein
VDPKFESKVFARANEAAKQYEVERRKTDPLHKELGEAKEIFDRLKRQLLAGNSYKMCPNEIFRECMAIAFSQSARDTRGKMLDGVPAPELFRLNEEHQIELLMAVKDKLDYSKGFGTKPLTKGEVDDGVEKIERLSKEIKAHNANADAFYQKRVIPALKGLFQYVKNPNRNSGGEGAEEEESPVGSQDAR